MSGSAYLSSIFLAFIFKAEEGPQAIRKSVPFFKFQIQLIQHSRVGICSGQSLSPNYGPWQNLN